jgi:hypothetical protein
MWMRPLLGNDTLNTCPRQRILMKQRKRFWKMWIPCGLFLGYRTTRYGRVWRLPEPSKCKIWLSTVRSGIRNHYDVEASSNLAVRQSVMARKSRAISHESCEPAAIQRGREHGSRGTSIVGSRYQTTASEDTENFTYAAVTVICRCVDP